MTLPSRMIIRDSFPLARKRWDRERLANETRRQTLLIQADSIARELLAPEAVDAAYIVGSLAVAGAHDAASDIDIAVLGLAPHRYLSILGSLQERLGTERVDLIELERTPFRRDLEQYGLRIL